MADLYLKRLEAERKTLWATCRLKGLAKDSPERQRIAELDQAIREHNGRRPAPAAPPSQCRDHLPSEPRTRSVGAPSAKRKGRIRP